MITITTSTKLSVKELAPALGKSVGFIYKARMSGLPMEWDADSRCYVATAGKVKKWLKKSKFKVVDGKPMIDL